MNADQDRFRLRHMLDAAEKIVAFTAGTSASDFLANEEKQLAVVRLLEVVGEAANSLSDEIKERHADIPWSQITATRNRLIHGYFDVDLNVVWRIVCEDVPALVAQLRSII